MLDYVEKAAQRHRLKKLGLDDVIPYSFECDLVDVVPVFDGSVDQGGRGSSADALTRGRSLERRPVVRRHGRDHDGFPRRLTDALCPPRSPDASVAER